MKVYESPHQDVKLPEVDILTLLFGGSRSNSHLIADTNITTRTLTFDIDSHYCAAKEDTKIHVEAANPSNSITKAEARDLIRQIAHVLRNSYGIGSSTSGQDVVLSTSSGTPFAPVVFYSIVAAGGVYSGASSAFTVAELVRQVKDAQARLLLCSPEFESLTVEAARQCGIRLDRVLIMDSRQRQDWKLISVADRANVLDPHGPLLDWKMLGSRKELEQVTACLLYSSGTTGLPKGVEITHWNLIAVCVCWMPLAESYIKRRGKDGKPFFFSTIAHLPMAHIGGISWSSLIPFYAGGTAYWVEKYDFQSFIEHHRRYVHFVIEP